MKYFVVLCIYLLMAAEGLLAAWAFSSREEQGLLSRSMQASHCSGFSCCSTWVQ